MCYNINIDNEKEIIMSEEVWIQDQEEEAYVLHTIQDINSIVKEIGGPYVFSKFTPHVKEAFINYLKQEGEY